MLTIFGDPDHGCNDEWTDPDTGELELFYSSVNYHRGKLTHVSTNWEVRDQPNVEWKTSSQVQACCCQAIALMPLNRAFLSCVYLDILCLLSKQLLKDLLTPDTGVFSKISSFCFYCCSYWCCGAFTQLAPLNTIALATIGAAAAYIKHK